MDSPHVAELNLSVSKEAVITTVASVAVVRGATVQHVSVVVVLSDKCLTKFTEVQSVVSINVIALKEQVDLIGSREHANSSETVSHICLRDSTNTAVVENHESVVKVEVRLHCHRCFTGLKFTLK